MTNLPLKKIILVASIAIIVVALAIAAPIYFPGESEKKIQITNSTNIEIYLKQYGGNAPIEQAELELIITNDGLIRVVLNNIDGFPVKEYTGNLTRNQLIDLANFLQNNNYFDLNEEYTTPEDVAVMDAGIAELKIIIDSITKKIVINPNINTYLPKNLENIISEFRTIIDKIINEGNTVTLKANIIGKVMDQEGNPIQKIKISIIKGTTIFPNITPETNKEGEFEFLGILPGTFTVAATDENDRIQTTIINVKLGDNNSINFILLPPSSEIKFSQFIWQKFGGIAGISQELIIASDGSISFRSNLHNDYQDKLTKNDLNNFIELIENIKLFSENSTSYTAKNGVADFFIYSLTLNLNGEEKSIVWVDDWASQDTLPQYLRDIQSYIENIIEEINH